MPSFSFSASRWIEKGVCLAARLQLVAAPQGSAALGPVTPSLRKLTVRSCKHSSSGRNDSQVGHLEFLTLLGVNAIPSSGWASPVAQRSRIHLQCRRCRFDPWVRKIPWRREWQPPLVFLPGKSHGEEPGGLQSIGLQELDMTEHTHTQSSG